MNYVLNVFLSELWAIPEFILAIVFNIWGLILIHKQKVGKRFSFGYDLSLIIAAVLVFIYFFIPVIAKALLGCCLMVASFSFIVCNKKINRFGFTDDFPIKSIVIPSILGSFFALVFLGFLDFRLPEFSNIFALIGLIIIWLPKSIALGMLINQWLVFIPKKKNMILMPLGFISPLLINALFYWIVSVASHN